MVMSVVMIPVVVVCFAIVVVVILSIGQAVEKRTVIHMPISSLGAGGLLGRGWQMENASKPATFQKQPKKTKLYKAENRHRMTLYFSCFYSAMICVFVVFFSGMACVFVLLGFSWCDLFFLVVFFFAVWLVFFVWYFFCGMTCVVFWYVCGMHCVLCDGFCGKTCSFLWYFWWYDLWLFVIFFCCDACFCAFFGALEHQKSKIKHKKHHVFTKKWKHRPPVIPKQHLALSYHIIAISSKLTSSRHRTISIPDGGASQCSWPKKNTMHHKLQTIKFTLGWDPFGFMIPPFVNSYRSSSSRFPLLKHSKTLNIPKNGLSYHQYDSVFLVCGLWRGGSFELLVGEAGPN